MVEGGVPETTELLERMPPLMHSLLLMTSASTALLDLLDPPETLDLRDLLETPDRMDSPERPDPKETEEVATTALPPEPPLDTKLPLYNWQDLIVAALFVHFPCRHDSLSNKHFF